MSKPISIASLKSRILFEYEKAHLDAQEASNAVLNWLATDRTSELVIKRDSAIERASSLISAYRIVSDLELALIEQDQRFQADLEESGIPF
jgi:hypothetical protein